MRRVRGDEGTLTRGQGQTAALPPAALSAGSGARSRLQELAALKHSGQTGQRAGLGVHVHSQQRARDHDRQVFPGGNADVMLVDSRGNFRSTNRNKRRRLLKCDPLLQSRLINRAAASVLRWRASVLRDRRDAAGETDCGADHRHGPTARWCQCGATRPAPRLTGSYGKLSCVESQIGVATVGGPSTWSPVVLHDSHIRARPWAR